jgi:WD40 repeat protein
VSETVRREDALTHLTPISAALADRYRIERELGAGGMATVYLAHDLKHDRKVAVKVLKPELAVVLGAERFVVEIKTTASLQHPHILPLFDSGAADGFLFYVMPYVEGETLRDKLNRETQLSVNEAIRITTEIADALDYAHRHGVIHRDIKPENILLHDGRPMVADFGIALALSAAAGGRMTETGLSLGTPHYMSPEQATADKEITGRADIYSLATMLYEMLAGQPPHVGASAQQIIMKIIASPVEPVTKYRKAVPPHVAAVLARALEKLPADRFDSARQFMDALANPTYATGAMTTGSQVLSMAERGSVPIGVFAIAVGFAFVAIGAAIWGWTRSDPKEVSRFSLALPDSQQLNQTVNGNRVALSPDGRTIVYAGGSAPFPSRLWVRRLGDLRATPLPGTERPANPSFSPDGKKIAFVTTQPPRAVKVVSLDGGPPLQLTDSLVDLGGLSWGHDGYIYYDGHLEGDGIARIRETGGRPEIVSRPDSTASENYHAMPHSLPNGRGVLMMIARPAGLSSSDIGVLDLRTGKHRVLTRGVSARYAASGHLVYVTEDGMLMASKFDVDDMEMVGEPVLIAGGLAVRGNQRIDIAMSGNGLLVYAAGIAAGGIRELVWVERNGASIPVDSDWLREVSGRASLAPSGRAAAFAVGRLGDRQVWVKQLDKGPASRVSENGWQPTWSPDGKQLLFSTPRGLERVPADGSSLPVAVVPRGAQPQYSPDGRWIAFQFRSNLVAISTTGDTTVRVLVDDPGNQAAPAFSPDGKWLAYASDETGNFQIYVRPFPDTKSAKWQVSTVSGFAPRWSPSGRELFYYDSSNDLYVAPIEPTTVFRAGIPKRMFSVENFAPLAGNPFEISPDGRRFLFTRPVGGDEGRRDELILVQNFFEELRAKSP